jgi:hypothetical protein
MPVDLQLLEACANAWKAYSEIRNLARWGTYKSLVTPSIVFGFFFIRQLCRYDLNSRVSVTSSLVMRSSSILGLLAAAVPAALACDSCYGPQDAVEHVRNVPRMQPGVPSATTGPKNPLEWGQINFMHTVRLFCFTKDERG